MEIEGIHPELLSNLSITPQKQDESSFQDVMNENLKKVSQLQNEAAELGDQLAAGEDVNLHDVMIAGQEADVALRLTVQLRNQALEAYREIIRMPI